MHHISVGVFLCRPWLLWRWLTWCGRTPTACRYPVRHANSSTHASLLWQLGQNDSLLSLYLLEREHVDLSMSLSHLRILLTSDSSDIPVVPVHYKYSISHLESSRSSVFTPQFAHLRSEILFYFFLDVYTYVSAVDDKRGFPWLHITSNTQIFSLFCFPVESVLCFNNVETVYNALHFSSPLIPRWWFISAFVTCHS